MFTRQCVLIAPIYLSLFAEPDKTSTLTTVTTTMATTTTTNTPATTTTTAAAPVNTSSSTTRATEALTTVTTTMATTTTTNTPATATTTAAAPVNTNSSTTRATEATTLASFFEDITVTIKPAPEPVYPLPDESLTDVRYEVTANHYWAFRDSKIEPWIVDKAPRRNSLTDAVYKRFRFNDHDLMADADVVADLQSATESIFAPLNSPLESNASKIEFARALDEGYEKSVVLRSSNSGQKCMQLLHDLREERYYLRKCLLSASDCDYGLSFAAWVQFLSTDVSNSETILATGPDVANGFRLYLQADELRFELKDEYRQWSIWAPFTKIPDKWVNIAVTWGKSTQTLRLLVDRIVIAELTHYTGEPIKGFKLEPRTLWVGCAVDSKHRVKSDSVTHGLRVSGVAMWYWPIRLDELLTASLETYLLSDETAMTTMESPISGINFKDYTSELEELVPLPGDAYPNNPMYEVADYYHPMQTALDRLNSRDGIRESASARNRYAYKLGSSNGYIKLNTFTSNECPKRLRLCRNGLSVGFWMHVPTTLVAVDTIADIIQLDGVFALSLFRETLNIFVGEEGTNGVFRILHAVPRDVWFNLGVSIHTAPIHHIQAYYNGMSVPVQQVEVPPRNGSSKETLNYSLFIGSKLAFQGAKGVSLNDLTMWYRALYNFESHRFVGYTRLQLEHLSRASHYWTPDIFLFQDSPSQIKMRQKYKYLKQREDGWNIGGSGYALASIYKSVKGTFRYDTLDYMNKSTVPVFEMHPNQYMVLGREKSSTPTLRNIVWDKHCLHNPSERLCGVRGFTISMWIKIITVSTARLRFYLNSGDSGTSSLTVRDYRGVAIFSEASLLGVSVSQRYTDWKLVSDSNSYKQGQWINIGILWDEKGGLAMLLDGVNYGIRDTKGDKVLKERLAPPHVVLGRLDDEDESTWLSPRQANIKAEESNGQLDPRWEMSHFALGEIVYYDRRISHNEYKSQLGVIGVPAFRRFQGYLWHGVELIDPPISHLASALKQKIVRPGPVLSDNAYSKVVLLRDPDAVELINGSSLRIGVLEENHCTRQVSFCSEGLSIGAWIRIGRPKFGADRDSEEPIILFTGANGRFGMAAKQNGHEVSAWVVPNATETQHADLKHGCWCTTIAEELVKRTTNLQWIHYALIWEPSTDGRTDTLHIAINGRIRAKCAQLKENNQNPESKWAHGAALRAAQLYTDTNTPGSAYLLISSTSLSSVGGTMAVAIVAMKSRVLADSSLMELMGLEYPQYLNMRASTFYWPFSGLLKELTPGRLRHSGVTYTLDKHDAQDGALCTDGTEHSYIALMGDAVDTVGGTNLVDACVVNPTPCGSFVFSMELKRRPFPFNNNGSGDFEHELFRSTPLDSQSDLVGLYITLSADTRVLVITVRTEFVTMTNYVEIDQVQINKWNKFEIIYTPKGLKVLSGDSVIGAMEKTVTQTKMNLPLSSIAKSNHHMYIGRGFPVCVSDVSTLDVPAGQDAENFIRSGLSTYCYTDTDLLIDFRGEHPDHLGLPDSATRIVELSSPIKIDKAPCFLRPKQCTGNEFTVSVWVRIDALYDPSHDKNPVETPTPMSAVLFTTGLPGRSGVTMNVTSKVTGNHTRKMDLAIRVYAGSEKWSLNSRNVIQLGEWVNLAVHWNSASEDRLGNLEIYINGTRKQSSSRPRRSSRPPQHDLTLGRLYFNKAYAEGQRNGGNIAEPLINGLIHNFAYWSSNPTTCFGPRSTKRKLLGECLTDPTLPETTTCTHIGDCEHAYGAVCLDPTVGNFRKMAEQANLLVDPKDFYRILSVGLDLVKEYEEKDQTKFLLENEMTLIKSILVFMRRWPHALRLACESWDSLHCRELQLEKDRFIQLLMKVAVSTSSSRWQDAWRELPKQGAIRADDLTSSASGMMQAIGSASLTPEEHHLNCSVHTSSGTAAILMINFKSPCPPAVIHLESQSHIHSKNLGHAVFTIRRHFHQNNTIQIGVVTLLGFPAANKTDILVAGGLKRKQFSERTLQGYKNSIFTPTTEAEEAILTVRKSASKLEIQSPVYVCNANPENMMGTKNLDDTILQFVIELSELNEHEATYFYRTTGRKRWKALESTMEQKVEGKGSLPLTYPVRCVRWETYVDGREMWDDACCFVTGANRSHVRCACNCLGVFAVAMEPRDAPGRRRPIWMAWGASSQLQHASWLEGLLVAINGLSAVCSLLLTFMLIMFLRKTTFKGPHTIRCILSAVYVVLHAVLLSVPYTEQRHIPCVSAGLLLHLSAVLSSSWQFCEVLTLFRSFVLGNFAINGLWIWTIGLISPLIVVGLPAGLSKLKEHGEDILCLPAHESNVFWTMFGIIFTYEAASITISLVTACNLETPAYLKPKVLEQLLGQIKRMNILIGFSTASWMAILLSTNFSIPYLPYAAFACISIQGTMVFLLYGLCDREVFRFCWNKGADYADRKNRRKDMTSLDMDGNMRKDEASTSNWEISNES